MIRKKRLGVGATVSCCARFLHPSPPVRDKYINDYKTARVSGLFVTGRDERVIRRKATMCVLITHADFADVTFHVSIKSIRLENEGHPDHFFDQEQAVLMPLAQIEDAVTENDHPEDVTNPTNCNVRVTSDDILNMRALGLDIDNDNDPAPENIPTEADCDVEMYGPWGFCGIDHRKAGVHRDMRPSLPSVSS